MANRALEMADIARHLVWARWRWQRLRGAALERYQERLAQRLVAYVNEHAPFYRDHWRGHELSDWRRLPTIDKQLMMANFDTFNTYGVAGEQAMQLALEAERRRDFTPTLQGLTVGLSSGTSGHRGMFLVSPAEQRAWAGTILARTLHRLRWQPTKVAFFLRSNSNLYQQVGGRLVQFRYFDLMLPIEQAVRELNVFQPDLLIGPPSLLGLLAQAPNLAIAPERLISVAEVLEPQDRSALVERFGAPVHQIYQCTEGLLAASCSHGALHVQEDLVVIQAEPLPGDPNRIQPIVTDLWRRAQPIVRYRLNDILTFDPQPCPCGSPFRVIARIEGRSDDVCTFLSRDGQPRPIFPDLIRRMVLLASDAIREYQAIQQRPGHLRLHIELAPQADWNAVSDALQRSVTLSLAQYDCVIDALELQQGLPERAPDVKRRRVRVERHPFAATTS